ncbi:MAG: phytanoyl-CoA dioxygenase family protein [Phycisphaeraceae bacterium]
MDLTYDQKKAMHDDGYLVLPGAVPELLIRRARKAIHHDLGSEGMHPDQLRTFSAQSYCPALRSDPALTDLATRSAVWLAGEALLGEGNLQPVKGAQIALRFPSYPDKPKPPRGHLDGIGTGTNGMAVGEFSRGFTMLAVCLLNDLPEPYMGNFTVWPGSHQFFEQYFRERDPSVLAQGMPQAELPRDAVQITGKAGDVVLAHHHLVHGAAPNYGCEIRYAAIFRLQHVDVVQVGVEAMRDIWREWSPIRAFIDEHAGEVATV